MSAERPAAAMTEQVLRQAARELWQAWSRWMAAEVRRRGWPLRAGDIILTGASAPPIPVHAGDSLEAVFDGLGSVEVAFVE